MSTITINDVLDGVVQALSTHFPDVAVDDEKRDANSQSPFFYVELFSVTQTQELHVRYKRAHRFDILYRSDNSSQRDMHAVAEQLYDFLETIVVNGKPIRGTGMRHEIVDQELHFFIDYDFLVTKPVAQGSKMRNLEQEGWIRG